jgi:hypothetical protein
MSQFAKILAWYLSPSTLEILALALEKELRERNVGRTQTEHDDYFWDTVAFLVEELDVAHQDSLGVPIRLKGRLN